MSLDTLLEAAHFIELQEQQQRQQLRTRSETPINSSTSSPETSSQAPRPPSVPAGQSTTVSNSIVQPVVSQFIIKGKVSKEVYFSWRTIKLFGTFCFQMI